jgi:hypothetical protein
MPSAVRGAGTVALATVGRNADPTGVAAAAAEVAGFGHMAPTTQSAAKPATATADAIHVRALFDVCF